MQPPKKFGHNSGDGLNIDTCEQILRAHLHYFRELTGSEIFLLIFVDVKASWIGM